NKRLDKELPHDVAGQQRAREEATSLENMNRSRHEYLQDVMGIKPNHPRYEDFFEWVAHVSIDNMSEREWRLGLPDALGNPQPSGKEVVETFHDLQLEEYERHKRSKKKKPAAPPGQTQQIPVPTPPNPSVTQPVTIPPNPNVTQPVNIPNPNQTQPVTPKSMERAQRVIDIRHLSNVLDAARDRLASFPSRKKNTPEYKLAADYYQRILTDYAKLNEKHLRDLDPKRTEDQRNFDSVKFLLDQSRDLRKLANKKAEMRGTSVGRWLRKNGIAQRVVTAAASATSQSWAGPGAILTAAATGLIYGAKPATEGAQALFGTGGVNEHSSNADLLEIQRSVEGNKKTIEDASKLVVEHFNRDRSSERKRLAKKSALGFMAIMAAEAVGQGVYEAVGSPDLVPDFQNMDFSRTVEGSPSAEATSGVEPSTHANVEPPTQPGQGSIDVNQGEMGSSNSVEPYISPETFQQGVDIPLQEGDGVYSLAERYNLTDAQTQKLLELMTNRHDGSTYLMPNGEVRLFFNDVNLHLSGQEIKDIISVG
ncbi:MAG TPA: hypothetical protein VFO38_03690, partial [Candidatus Saccharimonadales bacterium]|nr:hypothetical protein [Candidatus Saccharimonadales bacterium]